MNNTDIKAVQKPKMQWTDAQTDAINARGRNVLVCAAAGSGKTATLTERIIRRLTDPADPADISRMVVVTFTKNAATELKEKIYDAISKKLAIDPENEYLAMQLMKLPAAHISTIHSFCFDIIKKNLSTLGLPSSVRIGDSGECAVAAYRTMEQLICDCYDAEETDGRFDFSMLTESITTTKGEGTLSDMFLSLYKTLCSYPGGASKLERVALDYEQVLKSEFFDTVYGRIYKEHTKKKISALIEKYKKIVFSLSCENNEHPYLDTMYGELSAYERVLIALDGGYSDTREALLSVSFGKLKSLSRGMGSTYSEYAKALRAEAKATVAELCDYYAYTQAELDDAASKTAALSRTLASVLCEYERRYREEKRESGILDFNDLEYYAARLLYDGEERSEVARELESLIDEIYIDEYQDVNELQDSIFRAVSNGNNLFMVGDVKQSIYTFRGGDPSIITSLRDSYVPYDRDREDNEACTVFMQNNFRCDSAVVDYVNGVFATLLGRAGGKFEYKSEDRLVYTKDAGIVSEHEHYPRFVLCECDEDNTDPELDAEAVFVAEEIVRLLRVERKNNGERIRPSDIAILLRADSSHAKRFKRELERRAVPVISPAKQSPFDTPELQLVLCMLNTIDNPHRDIYLAGALMSEIYGVTVDELVRVKSAYPRAVSLYDAVCRYTESHGWEKGARFIAMNDKYRTLAKKTPVDRLIWQIYLDTPLLRAVTEKYGNSYSRVQAKKNCMLVYECARSFEQGAFRGLYSFIEYLNATLERGAFDVSVAEGGSDAVRIMSMHGSKGLEFPVCFVSQTGSAFNRSDSRSRLLFEPGVGIGFKLRGEDGFSVCETPFRTAVDIVKSESGMEEELRILYVALTRARERLYITAKPHSASNGDKLLSRIDYKYETFSSDTVLGISNFAEGLMIAHKLGEMPIAVERFFCSNEDEPTGLTLDISEEEDAASDALRLETLDVLRERLAYEYPHQAMTKIRAKMSVSKLYPSVLDEDEGDVREIEQLDFDRVPAFVQRSASVSAAERGTATHLIMQFADFARMERIGVRAELERLVDEGYIDARYSNIARLEDIERFLDSEFYRRIKNADRLWREFRFNLQLDAKEFSEDPALVKQLEGERILVQGVIDGFFLEGENIVLFDYKTDYLTARELSDAELARKKLTERHATQLHYYAMALERIFSRKVDSVYIYSLPLGREIRIELNQ